MSLSQSAEKQAWDRPRAPDQRPPIVLGTMNFGKRTPEAEARRIIDRAFERGVRVFDTANAYVAGESERILGRALVGKRDRIRVATKVGFGRNGGKPEGLSAGRIRAAIDESLERLKMDHVDLYYLHVPDYATPIEESLGSLAELLAAKKVLATGISNYASWQILEIFHACDGAGWPRPVVAQQLYNLLIRQLDVEYLRFARKYGLHTTVYNPLAGGLLTGRYSAAPSTPPSGSRFDNNQLYQSRYWTPRFMGLAEEYAAVARDEGLTPVELAYAWLAGTPGVDSIIVGPGSVQHLDQALDAIEKPVSADGRRKIDSINRAYLGTETTYGR